MRDVFKRNIISLFMLLMTHRMLSFSFCCAQIPATSSNSRSARCSSSLVKPTAADFSANRAAALYRFTAVSSFKKAGSKH